jgi:hypothetical protein
MYMSRNQVLFAACLFASACVSSQCWAASEHFHADMTGNAEVPPTGVTGTGSADATLDTGAKTLTYTVTWSGLTGPAIMAHFHGPAVPGKNGGVLVPLGMNMNGGLTPPLTGTVTLSDAQIGSLEAGMWYVNVHTPAHMGGEIRGQLVKAQ